MVGCGGSGRPGPVVVHTAPGADGPGSGLHRQRRAQAEAEGVRPAYERAYGPEPFVTVLADGQWPATAHVLGANTARVGVAVDGRTGRVTASCAIDNLVKGAAGQAIQAANVVLGLPETAGLPTAAIYP